MKILIRKNLSAHRENNKLTSIIFSLTLGCIIFIVVAASLQIEIFRSYGWGEI
jgi:FtsH-binding integral membrane protein